MAYTVLQEPKKDVEMGTRSAADLIGAAKADDCVDLTDCPASPLRKRDSQGNPKIGGKLPANLHCIAFLVMSSHAVL